MSLRRATKDNVIARSVKNNVIARSEATKQSLIRKDCLDDEAIKAFRAEAKVGILATINPDGFPHLTLITSIQAKDQKTLIWGQFSEGLSKENIRHNPKTAFLVLTNDRCFWRGKARWTHEMKEGEDYEKLNMMPMFRYNAYFGIHTVHYMDIVEAGARERVPLGKILTGVLLTAAGKPGAKTGNQAKILRPWAEKLFNRMDSIKFISWIGPGGFPLITPVIQSRAADSRRIVFSPAAFGGELKAIPEGIKAAIFCMSMQTESVLVRGVFNGYKRFRGIRLGALDIDWVYNSMPPKQGQIFPEASLEPVVKF